jgi:[CysO sulfur-carrier protein]-S-L-cysteine hydrolase
VVISEADRDALVEHAREASPNECCGYARTRDGRVEEVVRGENVIETSAMYGYKLDSKSLFEAYKLQDEDYEVAMYHSHPRSPAEPSQTDINLAQDPNWLYLIVSPTHDPAVRAWRIADGRVEEEDVTVE